MAWSTPSAWATLTIAFDGLGDGGQAISTTVISNGTAKDIYMDLSLLMGSITPGTSPNIEFHILPLLGNGTSYSDLTKLVDVVPLTTTTSAKNVSSINLVIPPGSLKVGLVNRTGATTSGSAGGTTSNVLQYRTYSPA